MTAGGDTGGNGGPDNRAADVRCLVVDDQAALRDGLATLLDLSPGIEVVGEAANGQLALAAVAELRPDVVLMDLHMPVLDGIAATERITAGFPGTRVVVLTTYADDESIHGALRAGALGYLTKDSGRAEITRAVLAAAAGQSVLDGEVQRRLVAAVTGGGENAGGRTSGPTPDQPEEGAAPDDLTARELEVLRLIAAGRSNSDIAKELFVSAATVKTHINHVFAKTGVRDRSQAVRYAYQNGLVR